MKEIRLSERFEYFRDYFFEVEDHLYDELKRAEETLERKELEKFWNDFLNKIPEDTLSTYYDGPSNEVLGDELDFELKTI